MNKLRSIKYAVVCISEKRAIALECQYQYVCISVKEYIWVSYSVQECVLVCKSMQGYKNM